MKKLLCVILTAAILAAFCACANKIDKISETASQTTASAGQTTQRITSTAAKISVDEEKGKRLEVSVLNALGNPEGAEVSGDTSQGSFKYKYVRDAGAVYANERSEEFETLFEKNAKKFVDDIRVYYSDEITFESSDAESIGNGDNGIDSVIYHAYFTNTRNQILEVQGNSDGVISYVDCSFTW